MSPTWWDELAAVADTVADRRSLDNMDLFVVQAVEFERRRNEVAR